MDATKVAVYPCAKMLHTWCKWCVCIPDTCGVLRTCDAWSWQVEMLKADVFRIFLLVPTVVTGTLASRTQARLSTIRTSGDGQDEDEYMEPEIVVRDL